MFDCILAGYPVLVKCRMPDFWPDTRVLFIITKYLAIISFLHLMFNISNIKTKVGKGLVQLFNEMIRFKRDFIPFFCP